MGQRDIRGGSQQREQLQADLNRIHFHHIWARPPIGVTERNARRLQPGIGAQFEFNRPLNHQCAAGRILDGALDFRFPIIQINIQDIDDGADRYDDQNRQKSA